MPKATPVPLDDRDGDLVRAAQGGDNDAFVGLIERHQARVFKLCGRFFSQPADVEDASQETFLTAWSKLSMYSRKAPFEHWLTRVCLNTCYMRLRRLKPEEPILEDVPSRATSPDARLDAERLLARLPGPDRFLLLMLHAEEWSVAEIARKTGWSKANVKVKAFRARRKLRKIVEEEVS